MNFIDIGIILVLISFLIAGAKNGVIKECVSLIGIIIIFFLSFALRELVGDILCVYMPWQGFQGYTFLNIFLYQALGFFIVFLILLSIYVTCLGFSNFVQKVVNATVILWIPSKILGAVVSLIKGYIIVYLILLIAIIPFGSNDLFVNSKLTNKILYNTPVLSSYTKDFTKPLQEVNKLINNINDHTTSKDEINIKAVKIMLKYDVISDTTLKRLIDIHKFKDVKGIEKVFE